MKFQKATVFKESLHCASRRHFSQVPSAGVLNPLRFCRGYLPRDLCHLVFAQFLAFAVRLLSSWTLCHTLFVHIKALTFRNVCKCALSHIPFSYKWTGTCTSCILICLSIHKIIIHHLFLHYPDPFPVRD